MNPLKQFFKTRAEAPCASQYCTGWSRQHSKYCQECSDLHNGKIEWEKAQPTPEEHIEMDRLAKEERYEYAGE